MEIDHQAIDTLYQLINQAHHCVAFTGAGVSTLSGIKDFRGKDGLYKLPDAGRMFDIEAFYQDPTLYYRMAKDLIYNIDEKKPSLVHQVLAKLETAGRLKTIITQNIDLLHQKAGSRQLIELHGSPEVHRCRRCGLSRSFQEVSSIVQADEVPSCPNCGLALKPDIVFFGENLPAGALEAAAKQARQADLLLVLGSSLSVYPAAGLPTLTLQAGGQIVIVNNQPTHLDGQARLCFDELATTFKALNQRLSI